MQASAYIKQLIDTIAVPVIVIDVDKDGRFSHCCVNLAAENYYGIRNEAYAGVYLDVLETDDRIRWRQRWRAIAAYNRCVRMAQTIEFQFKYRMPDGRETWAKHSCVPTLDDDGRVEQIMVTTFDITELVKSQRHIDHMLTHTLKGFVKICAGCKDIHHEGQWVSIERYADDQLGYQQFSHGICNSCQERLYGE